MRHFKTRKREDDGRWDYTCRHGGRTYPVGYCRPYREYDPSDVGVVDTEHAEAMNAEIRPFRDKYHSDGHETAEQARACYKEYLLDQRLSFHTPEDPDTLRRCDADGCRAHTGNTAHLGGVRIFHLCDDHLTREVVSGLMGEVGGSWCS